MPLLRTFKFKVCIYGLLSTVLFISCHSLEAERDYKPANSIAISLQETQAFGERIVEIAHAEQNRGPELVGCGLKIYPYDLKRYLKPHEAWCSEFVSWAYKAAGTPLTDGYEGGWMLKDHKLLRDWFIKHKRFITPADPDWSTFIPQPGDYIRYMYPTGGHSGIVKYVAGDFLYTIEGNVNNQVRERVLFDWRNCKDINGFGLREATRASKKQESQAM